MAETPVQPDASGRDKQRSRTGCRTCRSRKVKCDETPGGCRNCCRLNLPCPNSPSFSLGNNQQDLLTTSPENPLLATQAGLRRSRTYRSCRFCRVSKSRCSGERPVCIRCLQRGLDCSYDGKQAPAWAEAVSAELEMGGKGGGKGIGHVRNKSDGSLRRLSSRDGQYSKSDSFSSMSSPAPSVDDESGLGWLLSSELPDKDQLLLLVEEYFASVHNLRAFGFIHKPSFMQKLDEQSPADLRGDILLHVVCAFGAKTHALKVEYDMAEDFPLRAGTQWAKKAQRLLFTNMNHISIENLMAVALLHEHDMRIGNYASSFMFSGVGIRMAQALQINLESSIDVLCQYGKHGLSPSSRESRRRLMWAIYVMDAWVGSGVDELTLVRECDVRIQLPCDERNFSFEVPCAVEVLEPGSYLPFVSTEARTKSPAHSLDLISHFVRLVAIRKKVLRLVKHLDEALDPWLPDSQFQQLQAELRRWHDRLPYSLRFSRTAIYMRKESSQTGGLLLLHITYHQTFCDLNRIAMGNLFKILPRIEFPPTQTAFVKQIQDQCFEHAVVLSSIFEEAGKHGPDTLADTWLSIIAHETVKVIVNYVAQNMGTADKDDDFRRQVTSYLHQNIRALKRMVPMYALAKPLYVAAINMLRKENFELPLTVESASISDSSTQAEHDRESNADSPAPIQFTPEYILNPLAIFRMARKDIGDKEKHAPEKSITTAPVAPLSTDADVEMTSNEPVRLATEPETQVQYHDADSFVLLNGSGNTIGNFPLPTSFDDLQTYLPLMLNGHAPFSVPLSDISSPDDLAAFSQSQGFPTGSDDAAGVFTPRSGGGVSAAVAAALWSA